MIGLILWVAGVICALVFGLLLFQYVLHAIAAAVGA